MRFSTAHQLRLAASLNACPFRSASRAKVYPGSLQNQSLPPQCPNNTPGVQPRSARVSDHLPTRLLSKCRRRFPEQSAILRLTVGDAWSHSRRCFVHPDSQFGDDFHGCYPDKNRRLKQGLNASFSPKCLWLRALLSNDFHRDYIRGIAPGLAGVGGQLGEVFIAQVRKLRHLAHPRGAVGVTGPRKAVDQPMREILRRQ